jgi:hypothetical protein
MGLLGFKTARVWIDKKDHRFLALCACHDVTPMT